MKNVKRKNKMNETIFYGKYILYYLVTLKNRYFYLKI